LFTFFINLVCFFHWRFFLNCSIIHSSYVSFSKIFIYFFSLQYLIVFFIFWITDLIFVSFKSTKTQFVSALVGTKATIQLNPLHRRFCLNISIHIWPYIHSTDFHQIGTTSIGTTSTGTTLQFISSRKLLRQIVYHLIIELVRDTEFWQFHWKCSTAARGKHTSVQSPDSWRAGAQTPELPADFRVQTKEKTVDMLFFTCIQSSRNRPFEYYLQISYLSPTSAERAETNGPR
jgi:hypothetical protein